ncbi:MAG TPA: J domain-containing protein [Fimbriimonadaceae bacterium]|nr:J domain-containing protein [Fimbriimonadaceae bacterium]
MAKDYYAILGVSKNADEKAIKAAYRKLARKYHPDVNPGDASAEAKFKDVSEAHEILGNPEKRKLYDRWGSNWEAAQNFSGAQGGGGNVEFDFGDGLGSLFEQFFGGRGQPGGDFEDVSVRPRGVQPTDVEKAVDVTLEEIDTGVKRVLTYQVMDACKSCDGTGYVRTKTPHACPVCGGAGRTKGVFGMGQPCSACGGTGESTLEKCPTCRGAATTPTTRKVEVSIPAGIAAGKKLRVPGRGSTGSNGRAGDLYVVIHELNHPSFTRKADDLETEVGVPFTTAALGGEIRVPTLRGPVTMKIPAGSQSGQTFRLSSQGIAKMGGSGRGNLLAKIKVTVPKHLTETERRLIEELRSLEEVKA